MITGRRDMLTHSAPRTLRVLRLTLLTTLSLPLFTGEAVAQYAYSSPTFDGSSLNLATQSTFSIQADGINCSSGGGTAPAFHIGGMGGQAQLRNNNPYGSPGLNPDGIAYINTENPYRGANGVVSGMAGFVIPLGDPSNRNVDCRKVLALVESNNFLKMVKSMKELGIVTDEQIKKMSGQFFTGMGKRLKVNVNEVLSASTNDSIQP